MAIIEVTALDEKGEDPQKKFFNTSKLVIMDPDHKHGTAIMLEGMGGGGLVVEESPEEIKELIDNEWDRVQQRKRGFSWKKDKAVEKEA